MAHFEVFLDLLLQLSLRLAASSLSYESREEKYVVKEASKTSPLIRLKEPCCFLSLNQSLFLHIFFFLVLMK